MVLLLGLLIENHVGVVGDQQITLLNLNQAQQISQAALGAGAFFWRSHHQLDCSSQV
jgi:CPA1 family monovalent cation:H+ antiporter/cell volume regulation protein A